MEELSGEPVQVSTHLSEGEWTPETVEALIASYKEQLISMGATVPELRTDVDELDDGSVDVRVSWHHHGVRSFDDFSGPVAPVPVGSGADGVTGPVDEHQRLDGRTTEGSSGLGSVYGEADRSAHESAPGDRRAALDDPTVTPQVRNAAVVTDAEGNTHLESR
ncbi:hypothetical protein [Arthrobacter sp. UM1]|uniref:hypothetical protein n=1 Tax=Arthrobacter sp. UM1 TaxID=2766776 RepID=UPI001CF6618E|nr:hypothetical protein [Arthrobacter sp. UM1]MCB4208195.1 hypothetical protein [Arthrobacter sp. UM1]